MPDIQLPEISGMGSGLADGDGYGLDRVPEFETVTVYGSVAAIEEAPELAVADSLGVNSYGFIDQESDSLATAQATTKGVVGSGEVRTESLFGVADADSIMLQTSESVLKRAKVGQPMAAPAPTSPDSGLAGISGGAGSPGEDKLFADAGTVMSDDMNWKSDESKELSDLMLRRGAQDAAKDEDRAAGRKRPVKPAVFNPYIPVADNAFSTFSIDVDTASYGLARQQLLGGGLPDPEQVRTEEFINSFDYDYRPPTGKQTFAVHNEMAPSPFRMGHGHIEDRNQGSAHRA